MKIITWDLALGAWLVIASRLEGRLARLGAAPPALPQAEYRFLLQRRLIDDATLAKAESIAQRWGVHLHDVLIANGWIAPEDYYRALADACGRPFQPNPRSEVPLGGQSPRHCLAFGLLKERDSRFVFAPERLRPNALRAMLAQYPLTRFPLLRRWR